MALELQTVFQVGTIRVANIEELKKSLEKELEHFKQLPISKENMGELKAARARLNKASEAFNKRRIELSKAYNEPFQVFKEQVDSIIEQIGGVLTPLDKEIKIIEEKDREEKRAKIVLYFETKYKGFVIHVSKFFDDRWLNYGFTLEEAYKAIDDKVLSIKSDLQLIEFSQADKPELIKRIKVEYLLTLDLKSAFENVKNRDKVESTVDSTTENVGTDDVTIVFKVNGSKESLTKLSKFLKENGYKYERLQ